VSEGESVRIQRTRRALFDAAIALIGEQDEPVTVSELLRRADVSRGTFYTHFTGLEDLAVALFRDRFSALGRADLARRESATTSPAESSYLAIRDVVQHVVEHRALYLGVETLTGGRRAHETLVDLLYEQVYATTLAIPTRPADVVAEDLARFIAAGTMALLLGWMRDGSDHDVDEMTRRILALAPSWGREP
jgi:AcrR family transcriptional regulator